MPIVKHPGTGHRYDARPEQVRVLARSGWEVDEDQSPILPPGEDDDVASVAEVTPRGAAAVEDLNAALGTGKKSKPERAITPETPGSSGDTPKE